MVKKHLALFHCVLVIAKLRQANVKKMRQMRLRLLRRHRPIKAVEIAREQGMTIIALSDSPASPILRGADHGFVVSVDTPQFFPSSIGTIALLETLLSFVVAVASEEIVERVETFHKRRHQLGMYYAEDK